MRLWPHHQLRPRELTPGRYLTDGRRLVRIVSRFDDGRSVMVLVEDCRTFESLLYATLELRMFGFRRVRSVPAPGYELTVESSATDAGDGAVAGVRP